MNTPQPTRSLRTAPLATFEGDDNEEEEDRDDEPSVMREPDED
jgi:hypothetical protein